MTASMRAKMRITNLVPTPVDSTPVQEALSFTAVAKDGSYPSDGSDEDNTYARFSPSGALQLTIANPALLGKFAVGDTFYLDFHPVVAKVETFSPDPDMVVPSMQVLEGAVEHAFSETLVVGRHLGGDIYVAGSHAYAATKKLFEDGLAELERLTSHG